MVRSMVTKPFQVFFHENKNKCDTSSENLLLLLQTGITGRILSQESGNVQRYEARLEQAFPLYHSFYLSSTGFLSALRKITT